MDNAEEGITSIQASENAARTEHAAPQDAGHGSNEAARPGSRRKRLGNVARIHALVVLAALAMFAASDSWSVVTGLGLATVLNLVTAILAGVTVATAVHEWFHYLGARYVDAKFDIPARPGLFVFDWDFGSNSVRQFLVMSIAGSVGGILSVILLGSAVPADSWGRAALRSAAIASVIYAALIEWPVIKRVRNGGDPLTELLKIDQPLLQRSFVIAGVSGVVLLLLSAP